MNMSEFLDSLFALATLKLRVEAMLDSAVKMTQWYNIALKCPLITSMLWMLPFCTPRISLQHRSVLIFVSYFKDCMYLPFAVLSVLEWLLVKYNKILPYCSLLVLPDLAVSYSLPTPYGSCDLCPESSILTCSESVLEPQQMPTWEAERVHSDATLAHNS